MTAAAATLVVAFIALACIFGSVWIDSVYFWVDLAIGGATALMLAAISADQTAIVPRVLSARALSGCGAFSYSIYLVHLPVLHPLEHFLIAPLGLGTLPHFWALMATGLPLVVALSYLFYRVFERPFIEKRSLGELLGNRRLRLGRREIQPDLDSSSE